MRDGRTNEGHNGDGQRLSFMLVRLACSGFHSSDANRGTGRSLGKGDKGSEYVCGCELVCVGRCTFEVPGCPFEVPECCAGRWELCAPRYVCDCGGVAGAGSVAEVAGSTGSSELCAISCGDKATGFGL
mmetsp:Transcript_110008/g.206200  ORF Transcript_110008/g.206200 Transcript_110008/m.206200 type:complete len:129 (+) Transcript_110008:610-996(+)